MAPLFFEYLRLNLETSPYAKKLLKLAKCMTSPYISQVLSRQTRSETSICLQCLTSLRHSSGRRESKCSTAIRMSWKRTWTFYSTSPRISSKSEIFKDKKVSLGNGGEGSMFALPKGSLMKFPRTHLCPDGYEVTSPSRTSPFIEKRVQI